jgi:ankyrin repeat protein
VATVPLPERPNLEQLRKQARDLQRAVRDGKPEALALVAEHGPDGGTLSAARTTLARLYGFPSWSRLRRTVEILAAGTWVLPEPPTAEPDADRFLRLACLNYTDDHPSRRVEAAAVLAAHPELPTTSVAVAAVCADVEHLRALLAADPAAATRPVGPFDWSPLLYLAYARHDPRRDPGAALALLLDHGADPDDGRFFLGLSTPFTALTGLFASNDPSRPAHPHAVALATRLLDAGADPNDGQTLYNRMFGRRDDHLELLLSRGLGSDRNGRWYRLLGDRLDSPADLLAGQLDWALVHNHWTRVALLARHGVDVTGPVRLHRWSAAPGRTPIEVALLNGHRDLADLLRGLGAGEPALDPVDAFVAAALAGDADAVAAAPAAAVEQARRERPWLVVWAAGLERSRTIELLVGAGFDVNAFGREDVPRPERWQTALHTAVGRNDIALVRQLLELGADPDLPDNRFHQTAAGWARHFAHHQLVDLLT